MKIWLKGMALFLLGVFLLGGLVWNRYQQMYSDHLDMREVAFHSAYESIIHTFRLVSQTVVEENILKDEILKTIHTIVTAQGDLRNHHRGLLYQKLYPLYGRVSQHSIRQLHFHFPDGRSMLRFHVPANADDDLTPFRPSVVIANEQNCEVHGYESGRIVHGFRHVYPLNYQNIHIGSVEVSNSFSQIRAELLLNDVVANSTDYLFIMLKEDLWYKLAPGQEHFYVESPLRSDYLSENTLSGEYANLGGTADISDRSISIQAHLKGHPQLKSGLDSKEDFALVTQWENQTYSVLFHSIPNIEGRHAAYIISLQQEPYLQSLKFSAIRNFIIFVLALALLMFFWSRLKHIKGEQEQTLVFLKTITSKMGEGLYATDSKGNITYVNNEASVLLGYSENEMLTQNAHKLFHIDDLEHQEQGCTILNTIMNDKTYKQERGFFKSNMDKEFPVELTCTPIRKNRQIVGTITLFHDITKRKQKEAERENLEGQLRQKHKMEAIGYMAGGMAHNFNNNLAVILGNVELAQMKQAQNSQALNFLENAKIAILRSRDLIKKIITYSRKGIQHKIPMQLTTIIDETVSLLQPTMPTTVTLQKSFSPDWNTQLINADASQIQEILINLCNNAVLAMNETGELKILLEPAELTQENIPAQYDCLLGHYAKLSVQDNGCGMPAEMLDKIFDPFYSTKEEYEGAGMGLATVQGIVARHQGAIKVSSVLGRGTVFNLYFPLIEQSCIDVPTPENTTLPGGTEHLLFVDDDETLASLGKELLNESGYQVSAMTDSLEALQLFASKADDFDLVITDQTMPQLSGIDLIAELKKIRPDIPTILCTGYSSKVDETEARKLGINAFLMKPLALASLAQTVRRVLDGVDDG